jgi:hypothetical protein
LKKEELYEPRFEGFPFLQENQNQDNNLVKKGSAFSKAVGFKKMADNNNNNPIFDTTELNKSFAMGGADYNDNNNGMLANNEQPARASKNNDNNGQNAAAVPLNIQNQQPQQKQPIMSNPQLGSALPPNLSMPQSVPLASSKPLANFNIGPNFAVPSNNGSVY